MTKIVLAVNAMVSNSGRITEVRKDPVTYDDYYFTYDAKYCWEVKRTPAGHYRIWYFPGQLDTEELQDLAKWKTATKVRYSTEDLRTREARETFAELFRCVVEKFYGVEKHLDDIIQDGYPSH